MHAESIVPLKPSVTHYSGVRVPAGSSAFSPCPANRLPLTLSSFFIPEVSGSQGNVLLSVPAVLVLLFLLKDLLHHCSLLLSLFPLGYLWTRVLHLFPIPALLLPCPSVGLSCRNTVGLCFIPRPYLGNIEAVPCSLGTEKARGFSGMFSRALGSASTVTDMYRCRAVCTQTKRLSDTSLRWQASFAPFKADLSVDRAAACVFCDICSIPAALGSARWG